MAASPDYAYSIVSVLMGTLIPVLIALFFVLVINAVIGIIAVSMAKSRGLRPIPAFFAGFLAGWVALFFIALTPKPELRQ